jgi:carbon dioxide concentrating mechanism protein CcmN
MSSLIRSSSPAVIHDAHLCISGQVTIDPSAAIAPNVLLQADPDSQLIVAANVCIGMGCVLHAHQGTLTLEDGVTLGSGVLVVGQGTIGANACVGPMSTIINSSVLPQQMVPPGSLIGDHSRQVVDVEPTSAPQPGQGGTGQSSTPPAPAAAASPSPAADPPKSRVIYGQAYMERMMLTMFPYRQASGTEEKGEGEARGQSS